MGEFANILEVQPKECRMPLPRKKIDWSDWLKSSRPESIKKFERVMFFDPTELYKQIQHRIDPYRRMGGLAMHDLFPKADGVCACGCGVKPKSYQSGNTQRKWANNICSGFAGDVLSILNNYFQVPGDYISRYYGEKCSECEETNGLELDHIVGVKHGGGHGWLSNYLWRCKKCHRKKTNQLKLM